MTSASPLKLIDPASLPDYEKEDVSSTIFPWPVFFCAGLATLRFDLKPFISWLIYLMTAVIACPEMGPVVEYFDIHPRR